MTKADITIIGGGLAGLTAAIHLSMLNYQVVLFEKEEYPQHKICGEYLSKEVLPYFDFLGIQIDHLKPITIDKLNYSTKKGKTVNAKLPLGGLGISRYGLDNLLFQKAKSNGVEIIQENILEVENKVNHFSLKSDKGIVYFSKVVLGAFGKRSNLDKYFNRDFIKRRSSWLAVKSHYKATDFPSRVVALHNFDGGYCGLSKTESNHVNVCYLANYKSFKRYKNPISFQENVLIQNPHLNRFFSEAKPVFNNPLCIAQVSFGSKAIVENNVLMLGDAAGLIHPLCGNGMAMAIHSAKIAAESLDEYFKQEDKNFDWLKKSYCNKWNNAFNKRLQYASWLQKILLNERLAELSTSMITAAPFILLKLIKQTHGKPIKC